VPEIRGKIGFVHRVNDGIRLMKRRLNSIESRTSTLVIERPLGKPADSLHWAIGTGNRFAIAVAPGLLPVYCIESEYRIRFAMVVSFAGSIGGSAWIEHSSAGGTTVAMQLPHSPRN
jgi:hypothetical protein